MQKRVTLTCVSTLVLLVAFFSAHAQQGQPQLDNTLAIGKLNVISIVKLFPATVDGHDMVELSALAWNEDAKILYALSDHGVLFHLQLVWQEKQIHSIKPVAAYPLQSTHGISLAWPWADAEGMVIENANNGTVGDETLVISYEIRPRVMRHDTKGKWLADINLPEQLRDVDNYDHRNHALEAVTIHPQYGVITAPEKTLGRIPYTHIHLYAANGKQWQFQTDDEAYSLVSLETMPNEDLLMMQRQLHQLGERWRIRLSRLTLRDDGHVDYRVLATLSSNDERLYVDNFEGLSHHRDNYYFAISDDNEHPLQDMVLMYFQVVD